MNLNATAVGACFLALCMVVCPCDANGQAVLEGTVNLDSPRKSSVRKRRYQPSATRAAEKEPPAAVVYLEFKGSVPEPEQSLGQGHETKGEGGAVAELSQKQLQFSSSLLPVQVGTAVRFPNLDDEYHNVVSYSKAKTFDLGRYLKTEPAPVQVFDKPGLVELNCEIHEHMRAYILVLDTPFFTKTDENGRYMLENLPAGEVTVKVWIDRRTLLERPVTLIDGKTVVADFSGDDSRSRGR